MDNFKYVALQKNNELIEGEIEAEDMKDARRKIRTLGLIPTKVISLTELEKSADYKAKGSVKFLSLSQKIIFTSELNIMQSSGISVLETLYGMETTSPDAKLKIVCREIQNLIKSGMTFAESLDYLYGKVFGLTYISLISTGEKSGELEKVTNRLCTILKKQDNIKSKVIQASIYPSLLIFGLFILLVLFAKFVFPRFASVLTYSGGSLPPFAQGVIDFFDFIAVFWWLIILTFLGTIGLISTVVKNVEIKTQLDKFVLQIPVISKFVESVYLSNYLIVLETSYESGMPIMNGLELAAKTIGNLFMRDKAMKARDLLLEGKTVSESLTESELISGEAAGLVNAGEKSGNLGKMLKDASDNMDKRVDFALEAVMKLFEPTAIVIIAVFVAVMLIAFLQAYVSSLQTLF